MIKPVQNLRWEIAQKAEKEFWSNKFSKESILDLREKYSKRADFIMKECKKLIKVSKNTKILQIGCAAIDAINYIEVGKKYALDPLADFYKETFEIDYFGINFKEGIAEKLPYQKNSFDIIILANVLDHVQYPEKALSEINRILKKDGLLYLELDISSKSFIIIYKFWSFLHKIFGKTFNKPHPYIFSLANANELLNEEFNLVKKFNYPKRKKKFHIKFLDSMGLFSNKYYRALYAPKEKKE